MKIFTPYIQTIRTILIVLLIAGGIWLYKDWEFQKSENVRQSENFRQKQISDSVKYSSQVLDERQINTYLEYENKDLKKSLAKDGIKEGRIESIITNNYYYKDTVKSSSDVSNMIAAIRAGNPDYETFIDTSKCLNIKGKLLYDGKSLKVQFDEKEFKNKSDGVAYWERRQWSFLGIKTRFLGKKQFTAKVYDQCGQSNILKIEKKK